MDFSSRSALKRSGFIGFAPVKILAEDRATSLPTEMGVYLVVREDSEPVRFLERGSGGFFEGKDPNVPVDTLAANWIEDSVVCYVGKAGGKGSQATLRKRVDQLVQFGSGRAVGHRGGRYLWQIAGSEQLEVCWQVTVEEPRDVERRLIAEFASQYGMRPFANLRD